MILAGRFRNGRELPCGTVAKLPYASIASHAVYSATLNMTGGSMRLALSNDGAAFVSSSLWIADGKSELLPKPSDAGTNLVPSGKH